MFDRTGSDFELSEVDWPAVAIVDVVFAIPIVLDWCGVAVWEELLVAGYLMLAASGWFLLVGSRTLRFGSHQVSLLRRGRVRWSRPLSTLRRVGSLGSEIHWLVFADGKWVLWLCNEDTWNPVLRLASATDETPLQVELDARPPRLSCNVAQLRFPASECVGCGCTTTGKGRLTASRGVTLLWLDLVRSRELPIPVCVVCRRKRRWLGALWFAPLVLFVALIFGGLLLGPFPTLPKATGIVLAGGLLLAQLWFANFGERWADFRAYGVRVSKASRDMLRVTLAFRDRAQAERIASSSQGRPLP